MDNDQHNCKAVSLFRWLVLKFRQSHVFVAFMNSRDPDSAQYSSIAHMCGGFLMDKEVA